MATNLPSASKEDSAAAIKLFFDAYGQLPQEFSANDVEASIGFFTSAGFDKEIAISIAMSILKQAKADAVPVFQLLDSLEKFNNVQLSTLISTILNNDRPNTSSLGYKEKSTFTSQYKNIAA